MKGIPTVKFDTSRLTKTVLADLESNIRELPEIEGPHFQEIYDLALRSFRVGGDLHTLSTGIMAMNIDGITRPRAAQISMHLWFRAQELMDREQRAKIGITRARWIYSNAPCIPNPKAPAPNDLSRDAAHRAANGKIYVITDGMLLNGKRTWPGRELGCKCTSRSIIPGLEDK